MYALLLLLGVSFFFIFFLFSRVPDFEGYFVGSLFLEANLYILFSLLACLLVYKHSVELNRDKQDDDTGIGQYIPDAREIQDFFIDFFSAYIYYVAGVLLYLAIYLIFTAFFPDIDIGFIFLSCNIFVLALYFLVKKSSLGKDLVIVNLLLISLYYISVHVVYLVGFSDIFGPIDGLNIAVLLLLFYISLHDVEYVKYKRVIEHYFLIFIFLEIATLYKIFFLGNLSSVGIIAGILAMILLICTDEVKSLTTISKYSSRVWGLLFSGLGVSIYSLSLLFLLQESFVYTLLVLGISVLLLFFHKRFCSYFALSISAIGFSTAVYFLYTQVFPKDLSYIFAAYIALSFACILTVKQLKTTFPFDRYFFRIISVLVNLIGVILFLFFYELSILNIGLLLLGESIYLFFLYYSLRK